MLQFAWLLWASAVVLATKESPLGATRDPSYLKLQYVSQHSPRTQWPYINQKYRPQEDYREAVSHGYISHAYNTFQDATSEYPIYTSSSQEYWRPSLSNYTATSFGYSKPYLTTAGGASYRDSLRGSHSTYQYQQVRPKGSYSIKKIPTYYKEKYSTQMADTFGKPKFKKTILYQSPSSYKKTVYPRVHKPYAKNKYPMQKAVHPAYRRYYQSPYQQYAISSSDMLRYKDGYYKSSTAPTPESDRYYTTERMDDQNGAPSAEEYSNYNDTYSKSGGSYYEGYEEIEKATTEPEESSYDETTTRGYYGDRIYMSTQVPILASDKIPMLHKYYIIRRTSSDDDIETIFE